MNASPEQITLFGGLFCGRTDAYGTYNPATKKVWQVKASVTNSVLAEHLAGHRPYGVYLLKGDTVSAAVVDFDTDDRDGPQEFVRRMAAAGVCAYVERSKSKGHHVWVFFSKDGVKARVARGLFLAVLSQMGCPSVEVFPKQDVLTSSTYYGNFINAPLFGLLIPLGRSVFVDDSFTPFADQWAFLVSVRRFSQPELEAACASIGAVKTAPETRVEPIPAVAPIARPGGAYGLHLCAQRMLSEGVSVNQRTACFRLACQLRKAGLPYEYAVLVLAAWAGRNHPGDGKPVINRGEVESQTQGAYRGRIYHSCGCNDPSVIPFCDPSCVLKKKHSQSGKPLEPVSETVQRSASG